MVRSLIGNKNLMRIEVVNLDSRSFLLRLIMDWGIQYVNCNPKESNNLLKRFNIYGYFKELVLEGLGYMFMEYHKQIRFEGGYSHGLYLKYGVGVILSVEKKSVLIYGLMKKEVSDIEMMIKRLKKVDRYKGKGVRGKYDLVVLKVGKKR